MATAQPSTRKRRAARTRQAILDAARQLITERGPYNLSLREIARRIDYSPAGLYEYFGSKDEIIGAVVEEGFIRFANYLSDVSLDLGARDYLVELGIAYVRFARQNPEHFMLIFNTPSINDRMERGTFVANSTFQLLTAALERGKAEGVIADTFDVHDLTLGAWGIVHGLALLYINQMPNDDTDQWQTTTRMLLEHWNDSLRPT